MRSGYCALILAIGLSANSSVFAVKGSLWGDLDQPAAEPQATTPAVAAPVQPGDATTQADPATAPATSPATNKTAVPVTIKTPALVPQKTICDVFMQQPTLTSDLNNAYANQTEILRQAKIIDDQYQFLIATPEAANNLYVRYRELYMKTYCKK